MRISTSTVQAKQEQLALAVRRYWKCSERLADAVRHFNGRKPWRNSIVETINDLSKFAQELNSTSDQLNAILSKTNEKLCASNPGFSHWVVKTAASVSH